MKKVKCKCGKVMVPDWYGYTSGKIKCSIICTNDCNPPDKVDLFNPYRGGKQ